MDWLEDLAALTARLAAAGVPTEAGYPTLDLHGMTAGQAFGAVERLCEQAHHLGLDAVRVVHGSTELALPEITAARAVGRGALKAELWRRIWTGSLPKVRPADPGETGAHLDEGPSTVLALQPCLFPDPNGPIGPFPTPRFARSDKPNPRLIDHRPRRPRGPH